VFGSSAISADEIDRTVTRLMRAARVPGVALAIINGGQIVHLEGYGHRDVARREPMTDDTIMVGASFTKSAFAFAVMQLVDGGALSLDPTQDRATCTRARASCSCSAPSSSSWRGR
jgi:CubicO group peptidase (beta-lactamase class C family)